MSKTSIPLVIALVAMTGCAQYQVAMQDIHIPSYEPRPVAIPANCEGLIARAASEGMANFSEAESREVLFCQQQQIIRAQEEEAAAKLLESHAEAARFVFQTVAVVITGTVAVLTWIF